MDPGRTCRYHQQYLGEGGGSEYFSEIYVFQEVLPQSGDLPSDLIFSGDCSVLRRLVAQQACAFPSVTAQGVTSDNAFQLCFAGGYTTGPKVHFELFAKYKRQFVFVFSCFCTLGFFRC